MALRSAILARDRPALRGRRAPGPAADGSPCQRLRGKDLAPARHVKLVVRPSTERRLANGRRAAKLVGCVCRAARCAGSRTREGIDNDVAQDYDFTIRQVQGRIVLLGQKGSQIGYHSNETTRVWDLASGPRTTSPAPAPTSTAPAPARTSTGWARRSSRDAATRSPR